MISDQNLSWVWWSPKVFSVWKSIPVYSCCKPWLVFWRQVKTSYSLLKCKHVFEENLIICSNFQSPNLGSFVDTIVHMNMQISKLALTYDYLFIGLTWIIFVLQYIFIILYIDGLVQEKHNSIAKALDLRLPCTNELIWSQWSGDEAHVIDSALLYVKQHTQSQLISCTAIIWAGVKNSELGT